MQSLLFPTLSIGSEKVGVISTDYGASGRFSVINSEVFLSTTGFSNVHSDALARYIDGKVYVINRLNRDNIQVLNPNLGFLTELEFSTESGSNPQDFIKINSEKAYISRYNRSSILIVNPSSGTPIGHIDLSSFNETNSPILDNLPEMNQMYLYEGKVYIQVQRLDRNDESGYFAPNASSQLLEIDTSTDRVIQSYTFQSRNPMSKIQKVELFGDPHLIMALPNRQGFLSKIDGGVEGFNLKTKSFYPKFLYSESEAGGDILDVKIKNDSLGFAFVLDLSLNKYIQSFNPSTGKKISTLAYFPANYGNISGLALSSSGKLYTGESNFSKPGVAIYDTNNDNRRLNQATIDVGLRPFDIIVLE
ncbi:MAG: hypothetical protein L6Q54_12330 [Leptospiraceae bacterium]|nr:hypothetical protein [Leptospiraceae bacterium]